MAVASLRACQSYVSLGERLDQDFPSCTRDAVRTSEDELGTAVLKMERRQGPWRQTLIIHHSHHGISSV
jgi:hypothetical protein